VVLLGDALRTAHFSAGSGTRLAMEDAVALSKAMRECGCDLKQAFALCQETRMPQMETILGRGQRQPALVRGHGPAGRHARPGELAYSSMTRTGRVSRDEVRRRDPGLAAAHEAPHPPIAACRHSRAARQPAPKGFP